MSYKSNLILEAIGVGQSGGYGAKTIKMKVRKGMTREHLKEILNVEDTWEPGEDERIYFFPGCTVPRFKVREKFKVTIKPEYATSAFLSIKGLEHTEGLLDKEMYLPIDAEEIINYFEKIYGANDYKTVKLKSVAMNCEDQILMDYQTYYNLYYEGPDDALMNPDDSSLRSLVESAVWPKHFRQEHETPLYIPNPNGLDLLNCTIYSQDAILKILNEGKIVIDEKKYQDLRLMGLSADDENIVLMMEIMANSDYQKSFVYLLLLLKEFNSKISEQKAITHVNFKSLLNYYGLTERDIPYLTIEQLTATMKKLGKFTRSNVQRVTQFFGTGHSCDFTSENYMTGPVLRPEAERDLDEEYLSDDEEIEIPDEC